MLEYSVIRRRFHSFSSAIQLRVGLGRAELGSGVSFPSLPSYFPCSLRSHSAASSQILPDVSPEMNGSSRSQRLWKREVHTSVIVWNATRPLYQGRNETKAISAWSRPAHISVCPLFPFSLFFPLPISLIMSPFLLYRRRLRERRRYSQRKLKRSVLPFPVQVQRKAVQFLYQGGRALPLVCDDFRLRPGPEVWDVFHGRLSTAVEMQ